MVAGWVSRCVPLLLAALREGFFFVSLSFGFGSIKLIMKVVQQGNCLAGDAHELGVA